MEFIANDLLSEDQYGEFYSLNEKYHELDEQRNNLLKERCICYTKILQCVDYYGIHEDELNDGVIQDFRDYVKRLDRLTKKIYSVAHKRSRIRAEIVKLSTISRK